MNYPELSKLDSTPEQDLGLNIAFKMAVNAGSTETTSPGEYLALRVSELLDSYTNQHVSDVKRQRVVEALSVADTKQLADVATALGVDLTVEVPEAVDKAG